MKQIKIGGGMLGMLVLLVACGETPAEETPEQITLQQPTNSDSLLAVESDLTETTEMTAEAEITEEKELLAENLNEADNSESSQYIKTELHDVVLSRKTPDPNKGFTADDFQTGDSGNGSGHVSAGREIISAPIIKNPTVEEGVVSVKVTIDASGVVTSAKVLDGSANRTNTSNSELHNAALKYSRQYRFAADPQGMISSEVIDIHFLVE